MRDGEVVGSNPRSREMRDFCVGPRWIEKKFSNFLALICEFLETDL